MPFKIDKLGNKAWVSPTDQDYEEYKSKISQGLYQQTPSFIPSGVQNQLNKFLSETLAGSIRLADSNKTILKTLTNIISSGIKPVDIILPVYGSLHVVEPCINSVLNRTNWPFKLTIVDDFSDNYVRDWLAKWNIEHPQHSVIYNKKNKGFSATVNTGIRATSNPYICILNSDVIVTDGWLTKLVMSLEADPRNKIANPVTNNTALINVAMQEGASYLDMNRALELTSSHRYPEIMPTGFCFMTTRELVKEIGYLDEGFQNYGEETDWWMRAIHYVKDGKYMQWRAVLADDSYVFHERGTSFSALGESSHMNKRKEGSSRFHTLWPGFKQWQNTFDVNKVMAPLRSTLPVKILENPNSNYNIAFVVYSTGFCGGMKFIADIVNQLNENGINAKVVQIKRDANREVNPLADLRSAPIVFNDAQKFITEFEERVFSRGIVVAATNELTTIVTAICAKNTNLKSVLFAQSHDPWISPDQETRKIMELAFKMPQHIITNSKWLNEQVNTLYGTKTEGYVSPGINRNLFYPKNRASGDERPTILMSLMKTYPFKGYDRGVKLGRALQTLSESKNIPIRIMAYGTTAIPECPHIIGLGDVSQSYLANLLGNECDFFCDPSYIHTYGMPALEAMVSGVVPVMWDNYGINEYAKNGHDSIIYPPKASSEKVAEGIFKLIENPSEWEKLKNNAIAVNAPNRNLAVYNFIGLLEKNLKLGANKKKINVFTPHLRKHGGPTSIIHLANSLSKLGHDVQLYTIYSDINPEVISICKVPIMVDWNNFRGCDVLISNSDNPENPNFVKSSKAKKKVMLKLSHNPRFQQLEDQGLNLNWDEIITSTQWLKEICLNPDTDSGWTYKPKEAKRVGWYHYGHSTFDCKPENNQRKYNDLTTETPIVIATLAHHHPSKGTVETIQALEVIKKKYLNKVNIVSVGEWPDFSKIKPNWINYYFSLNRTKMAEVLNQTDIWISGSHSEGLGRLNLEAMSSGCACVLSDTSAEFTVDKVNCLLYEKKNVEQLITAIDKLISDNTLRGNIAAEGYRTAKALSDSTDFTNNLNTVIEGLFNV